MGVGHMRASRGRSALPAFVLMNALWSGLAFATVVLAPHRATSALLMTGINHLVFSSIMILQNSIGLKEVLGLEQHNDETKKIV